MYRRKAYEKLLDWKAEGGRTDMLIEGARRVGKTTLAQEFARREYPSSLYLDFSVVRPEIRSLFEEQLHSVPSFLNQLQILTGTRLEPRKSLVVFDEVQAFPRAREAIKHLVADGRFDYLETGSLISLRKNVKDILIPSEERRMDLNPLDFEEWLWATDGSGLLADAIDETFRARTPLPDALHKLAMRSLREYLLVGGMPQSIEAYGADKDFFAADQAKRRYWTSIDPTCSNTEATTRQKWRRYLIRFPDSSRATRRGPSARKVHTAGRSCGGNVRVGSPSSYGHLSRICPAVGGLFVVLALQKCYILNIRIYRTGLHGMQGRESAMFKKLGKGRLALAIAMVAVFCLGFAAPALAVEEATYDPDKAMLTKVIDGAVDTDASADTYVFHFAGAGEVKAGDVDAGEDADKLYSDGVEQDTATLKVGDVVPTISDETLTGVKLTAEGTLNNGQVAQGVVQKSISDILKSVEFPHAGVYTYVVTERSVNLSPANAGLGIYVNASQAEYVLRIRVTNAKTENSSVLGDRTLEVESVTVEQTKDDNGDAITKQKIDPTYPTTTPGGSKIDKTAAGVSPTEGTLAGDGRGRDVPGFTFANEYIVGGSFQVKKLYDGDHSDRTKYSTVKLVVYSEAAKNPDAKGACVTYKIEGQGIDRTNNKDEDGAHRKLNGINQNIDQVNDFMVPFDDNGFAVIVADLKEDSLIRVTGEFGPYNESYAQENAYEDMRMTLSTSGLLVGQTYYVIEALPGDYDPTGYVYVGDDGTVDPRVSGAEMKATQKLGTDGTDPAPESEQSATIPAGGLLVKDDATGNATTVFVVNKIDENKVSPTGIFINNLPYILMVGIPVAVFATMFVIKRRGNASA